MKTLFRSHRHDATTEELADGPKSISTPLQCILEHVMLIRRLNLSSAKCPDVVVSRGALRALKALIVHPVEASLVKGMLAQEMDSRQFQTTSTGRAPSCLKDCGLIAELVHFLSLCLGLGAIAFDQTAVL